MKGAPPSGWFVATLQDLVALCRDRSQPKTHPNLPYVGMDNVEAHTMRLLGTVPASTMKSSAIHFLPGDVLYGRLRPYLNKVIAPAFEGLASAEFIPLTPEAGVHRDFIRYRLNSADFVSFTSNLDEGDRPRVDWPGIRQFSVALPPSEEQQRIVEAVDSYLSRLDAAVASLVRMRAKLKAYRASVLKAAVEGCLVPTEAELARREGRSYEPAEVLLARILAERRRRWEEAELGKLTAAGKSPKNDKWKAKYKEPLGADTSKLPALPEGWCWATIEALSKDKPGSIGAGPFGTIFKAKDFRPTGVPIIFLRHVKPDRFLTKSPAYMDATRWHELFRDYSVYGGELLVTKLGDPPGDCAIFPATSAPAMVTPDVMKLDLETRAAKPRYVMHYINSRIGRGYALGTAFGTTRLRLTLPLFRAMPVPLPPLAEQERVVEAIDQLLSTVDSTADGAQRDAIRCGRLRQAILKWAFEGWLVDQDPADEPAEVLLTRIRAERAAVVPPRRLAATRRRRSTRERPE